MIVYLILAYVSLNTAPPQAKGVRLDTNCDIVAVTFIQIKQICTFIQVMYRYAGGICCFI